jgi:hypothetical protein
VALKTGPSPLRTAPPVAGLKDRELRSLEERRLWRLEAKAECLFTSNEVVLESAVGLMVLKAR